MKNPVLGPAKAADGALSGSVTLKPGDSLHFYCHIEFTEELRARMSARK